MPIVTVDETHRGNGGAQHPPGQGPSGSKPWQFWRSSPPYSPLPQDEEDAEDGEVLLPTSTTNGTGHVGSSGRVQPNAEGLAAGKKREQRSWITAGIFTLLLGIGLIWFAIQQEWWRFGHSQQGDDDSPSTLPVWVLPSPSGLPSTPMQLFEGKHGAVASEEKRCSDLGLSILRDMNGTAVDAAITSCLCVGLLNGFASGIGGGGFMTLLIPEAFNGTRGITKEMREAGIFAIDYRETSPASVEKDTYGTSKAGRDAAQKGGLAIGVPGELRGLQAAHKMYGSIKWEDLVMPVAKMAKEYHEVSREVARRLRIFGQFVLDDPTWSAVYAPNGYLAVEGDWIKRENYGKTLEAIAKHGADAFYTGPIAESSIAHIQSLGGFMTLQDLEDYQALVYPAIHQTFHNRTIYTSSAPSSGGIMLAMLNLLEPYNLASHCWDSAYDHLIIEAMQHAFGARSFVTDPAFAEDPALYHSFYAKKWADKTRKLITNETHPYSYYGLQHDTPIDHGTMHVSVVDRWGGAVSLTSTVNLIWGSHVMDPNTGIIFNDEQDDFAIPGAADAFGLAPSPWNYPAPGKKPLSSTAPSIVLNADGSLHVVIGGSGGSRIFGGVAQVLLNMECGLDIAEAIGRPRLHSQVVPPVVSVEVGPEGEDVQAMDGLRERGHDILLFDINAAVAEMQAVYVENGRLYAASDARKHGVAAAY